MKKVIASSVAAGVLAGGLAGYALTERGDATAPRGEIACEARVVSLDSDHVLLVPVVHALGTLSAGSVYTRMDTASFVPPDPRTGEASNDNARPRVTMLPGILPMEVLWGNRHEVQMSIVITNTPPMGSELPLGAQDFPCPTRGMVVTT